MIALGAALAVLNVYTTRRDLALATGPRSDAQRRWLVEAAERPDIAPYFKKLSHPNRLAMARAVGRYDDATLAKLCGILLADFDEEARSLLVTALKRIAAAHPKAVAAELARKGGFQTLGVSEALRTLGPKGIPEVASMLDDPDARPAAVAYLVEAGDAAIPALLQKLKESDPAVRLAAADALGGLRARTAVPPLLRLLKRAKSDERPSYIAALSAIGDPGTSTLLESILRDSALPLPERTAAAVGLGRIGGIDSARTLWSYASSDDPVLAKAANAALASVGAVALDVPAVPAELRIELAGVLEGGRADAVLRQSLRDPATRSAAVKASKGRLALVSDLAALLPQVRRDGRLAAALVSSLALSAEGRDRLMPYRSDPDLSGFIARALA